MHVLNMFLAFAWFALFISLFFGFSPDKVLIGIAFLTTSLHFSDAAIYEHLKRKLDQ